MEKKSSKVYSMKSAIQRFYEDKTILLTGGTGFLGKILIEKLLRSCPNIHRIYLLVREKRGVSAEGRLSKLLESEVFTGLRKDHPKFSRQLTVIPGDLSRPLLGLASEHVDLVRERVQIIFHSAATLRFDERLSIAIGTNVSATKQLCLIAQEMVNLKAFVYVSTAYCNCDCPLVQEKISPPRIPPESLINLLDLVDDKTIDDITPILLGSKPNTYIFTKCVAEEIINSFKSTLPVAIFRPSIVLAAASEPLPGWIDNVLGPTGMAASLSAGLLHTALFNPNANGNFVPVDYTVNGIIALAYSIAQHKWESSEDLRIVNFVSTADNTITWGRFGDLLQTYVWENPSQKLMWYPFAVRAQNHWTYTILRTLFHYLPAAVIDWSSTKFGRPTRLRHLYNRLDKYAEVVKYFCIREFNFEEKNASVLWSSLDPDDQQMFPFNMASLNWRWYMRDYVRGCRRFLLKEDPATIGRSRKRMKLLYLLHLVTTSTVFLLLLKVVIFTARLVTRSSFRLQIQQGN